MGNTLASRLNTAMIAIRAEAVQHLPRAEFPAAAEVFAPMRLLIVDDHPMTCTGLKSLLQTCYPSARIQTQHDVGEWVQQVNTWDYVFLDMHLPGVRFATLLDQLAAQLSRVILISASPEADLVAQARVRGVRGLLLKNADVERILDGFRRIQAGEAVFADCEGAVINHVQPSHKLTERQQQVLEALLGGLSNKQIARKLGITEHTVKDHVAIILSAYGARNRMSLLLQQQRDSVV